MRRGGASGGESDFWLRLVFTDPAGTNSLRFSWYDRLSEMRRLFGRLRSAKDDEFYCDLDQGWRFTGLRRGEVFHFLQDDPGDEAVAANAVTPRAPFLGRIDTLEARATAILERLADQTGVTAWL